MAQTDPEEDPFASLSAAVACHVRDWSEHRRDAWIYGIVVGWEDALAEVARDHRWDAATVERLTRLRAAFVRASERQAL